ncbi:LCP family protein [Nocardioides sp. T2.26MG-1]|uniref:LCP family protein n=1 Tax=Nocardioides sp. T2.26MG-1 TaxID=3041166 RepID=UPI002477ADC1|nr:LCP family protein [Nocardioides sp. T2.26MG-1]CAI9418968.1 Polyisoprenyl-teichoic acid--peptidoglycan teichoic acid transferase TagU [Nocardioides sp. T2.26MG-1]
MPEVARHHRRTALRVIVVAELVIAMVTAATVVFAYNRIDSGITAGEPIDHEVSRPKPVLDTSELNILVMGSDARDCEGCDIDKEAGEGGSDTTMLIHVEDGRKSAYGISIARDILVDRPDCTNGSETVPGAQDVPWNEAFALGGPECTVKQLEAVTGIYVDSYITLNFGGFKGMVDAVHGVEVCIPEPIDDELAHIHFDAGTQTLDGDRALQYVRERHSTANSDLGRMKRQQAFIASMIGKVKSADTLTRPDRLYSFARALTGSIETSPDLASAGKLVKLAMSVNGADLQHIKFVTAPTTDFPVGDPNWGRLRFTPDAEQLWQKVTDDEPLGKLGKGAVSGSNPNGSKDAAAANGLCA